MNNAVAIELKHVTKTFGHVVANYNVDLDVRNGEILAILGENGSGKTTLMNMISGIYYPDDGQIFVGGEEVIIRSPKDAFRYKIGMIHQHFKLVDVFTAAENIILGIEDGKKFSISEAKKRIIEITERYGFNIEPDKKIYEMSVSEKQTVEIIKVLYRGADILILDEPTAVLTPQETERLFSVLRRMRAEGKSVIIITHKLHEVLEISDRVAVLCKGQHVATVETRETDEAKLTEMMVGKKISLNIERTEPKNVCDRLIVKHISCTGTEGIKILDDVSFEARSGEILGIAGIAGSGQRELLEAIAGLQRLDRGEILYLNPQNGNTVNLRDRTPIQIRELGVRLSFVPEDRLGMGLVGNMNIIDNMMLRSYRKGKSLFLNRKNPHSLADQIIDSLQVVTPSAYTPVRKLSGGNVQKVLVGREISSAPSVLMTAYPVRGLDINSSYTIYNRSQAKKDQRRCNIVGEGLDSSDRVVRQDHGNQLRQNHRVVDGRNCKKGRNRFPYDKNKDNCVNRNKNECAGNNFGADKLSSEKTIKAGETDGSN